MGRGDLKDENEELEDEEEEGVDLAGSSMTDVQGSFSYLDPYRNLSAISCNSGVPYDVMPKFPPPHPYFIHQNPGGGGLGLGLRCPVAGSSTESLFTLPGGSGMDAGLGLSGSPYGYAPSSGMLDGGRGLGTGYPCLTPGYTMHPSNLAGGHPMLFSSQTSFLSSSSPCPSDHNMANVMSNGSPLPLSHINMSNHFQHPVSILILECYKGMRN